MSVEATAEPRSSSRRTWLPVLVLTLIIAVPAFLVNPIVWSPAPGGPAPTTAQIPYLIALDVMQAVFLGLGVSFLLFGLPIMRSISPDSKTRAWAMYLSIAWLMISWWPHIGMHVSNAPDNLQGLIYIDYLFHVPLMIAGAVLAYCFFSLVRRRVREPIAHR
jgi:predicted membrane channel-forming protein YqfA (hemolysin III family)